MADELGDFLYPLDVTGEAASNRVPDERHTLIPAEGATEFNFIIPKAAPFFLDSVILTYGPSNTPLVRNTHWFAGHRFMRANEELYTPKGGLYGSILLKDKNLAGYVTLTYQTLGGAWTMDEARIIQILNNRLVDPRIVSYEQVNGKPEVFPPMDHGHNASTDFTGFQEVILALNEIPAAIAEAAQWQHENPPVRLSEFYTRTQVRNITDPLETRIAVLEAKVP